MSMNFAVCSLVVGMDLLASANKRRIIYDGQSHSKNATNKAISILGLTQRSSDHSDCSRPLPALPVPYPSYDPHKPSCAGHRVRWKRFQRYDSQLSDSIRSLSSCASTVCSRGFFEAALLHVVMKCGSIATVTRAHSLNAIMSRLVSQYWKHPFEISTGPSQQSDRFVKICSGCGKPQSAVVLSEKPGG